MYFPTKNSIYIVVNNKLGRIGNSRGVILGIIFYLTNSCIHIESTNIRFISFNNVLFNNISRYTGVGYTKY